MQSPSKIQALVIARVGGFFFFLEGNGALPVPSVGCGLTWVWGGPECQMARSHLICREAAPECRCAIMDREKGRIRLKEKNIS